MRNLLAAGVVLVLVAGAIWWLGSADAPARPPQAEAPLAAQPDAVPAAAAPVVAAVPAETTPDAPTAAPAERTEAPRADATRPEHVLRGRVVDANGQPLAGIDARLTGWTANSQRLAEWTKDNAEPERIDQKLTTGPDGVFTFRCWPPPPFQFSMRLLGSGVATWSRRWSTWEPGGTTDLGDVKLERGTLLRGRVVDSTGTAVAKVEVRVNAAQQAPARDGFETRCSARTGDDGTFVQGWPLRAGDYTIGIDDQIIERGDKVALTGEPEQVVDVVCKRIDPSEMISGVVVDETGAPIRGAMVHPFMSGGGRMISTDAEGRFRVLKREGAPAEVALAVQRRGYEAPPSQEKYAWGRNDVRIVMTRGKELTVFAVRAADGAPLEDYVLRVIPLGGSRMSSEDNEPRGKPPHEGGRVVVPGIPPGKARVVVEPKGDDLAIGVVVIEVGPNGTAPVTVRLAATSPRTVRVVVADGTPVAGAKVQLVDSFGEPLDKGMPVSPLASVGLWMGRQAIELAARTTDANGDCTLPVPGDRAVALKLPGPGHTPLVVQPAVFPADGPLVVTVSSGAVLRGQLGPEGAWAELRRLASSTREAPGSPLLPSVWLHRGEGRALESFPSFGSRPTVNADGSFELTGIPPGQWHAYLVYFTSQASGGSRRESIGLVDLVDGQVTTIAPDLSGLLPGTLEALVMHGGAPLANTLVSFQRSVPGAAWPEHEDARNTDAEGRVQLSVRPGEYRVVWAASRGESASVLRSTETAVVRVGETTRQTFTILSGTLKVRLVDSTGAPVANVRIELEDAAGAPAETLAPTGRDGRVEQRCAPGTFTAWVMPKRLQDQNALREFYGTVTDAAAIQRVRVKVGAVTVGAGETNEIELRLPADW